MLRTFKWRLILSLSNLVAAVAQSALGLHEAKLIFQPPQFHDDPLFTPPAQLISNCINAPAFLFTNLVGNMRVWRIVWAGRWLGGEWFYHVSVSFYVALFFFWWWIGWRLDIRSKPRDYRSITFIGNSLGIILSLTFVYIGLDLLLTDLPSIRYSGWPAILPISTLLWGIILLFYFVRALLSFRNLHSQSTVH